MRRWFKSRFTSQTTSGTDWRMRVFAVCIGGWAPRYFFTFPQLILILCSATQSSAPPSSVSLLVVIIDYHIIAVVIGSAWCFMCFDITLRFIADPFIFSPPFHLFSRHLRVRIWSCKAIVGDIESEDGAFSKGQPWYLVLCCAACLRFDRPLLRPSTPLQ